MLVVGPVFRYEQSARWALQAWAQVNDKGLNLLESESKMQAAHIICCRGDDQNRGKNKGFLSRTGVTHAFSMSWEADTGDHFSWEWKSVKISAITSVMDLKRIKWLNWEATALAIVGVYVRHELENIYSKETPWADIHMHGSWRTLLWSQCIVKSSW